MRFGILSLSFCLVVFASMQSFARDGVSVGTRGGGNGIALEFFDAADKMLTLLEVVGDSASEIATIKNGLDQVYVVVTDDVLSLEGSMVTAINVPDDKNIFINQESWNKLDKAQRESLVLHELLGVFKLPDTNYEQSTKLYARYQRFVGSLPEKYLEGKFITVANGLEIYPLQGLYAVKPSFGRVYIQQGRLYSDIQDISDNYCSYIQDADLGMTLPQGTKLQIIAMNKMTTGPQEQLTILRMITTQGTLSCVTSSTPGGSMTFPDLADILQGVFSFSAK